MVYAFVKLMKRMSWYAFGLTPKSLAERMEKLYSGAQFALDGDYTNMDGSIGGVARELDLRLYLRVFHPSLHPIINEVARAMYGNVIRCPFKTTYPQGYSQGSGFPDTSSGNTCRNAFNAYVAWRRHGHTAEKAWKSLGLYGGDDGSTPDLPAQRMIEAAEMVGQVVKVSVIPKGVPIPFLGRIYEFGGQNSMCDVKRQIDKLHVTTRSLDVPNDVVAHDKGVSGLVLDSNTPLIGDVFRKWASIPVRGHKPVDYSFNARWALDTEPCPNYEAQWMHDEIAKWWEPTMLSRVREYCAPDVPWCDVPCIEAVPVKLKAVPATVEGTYHEPPVVAELPAAVPPTAAKKEKSKMTPDEYQAYLARTYTQAERDEFARASPSQRKQLMQARRSRVVRK